MREQIKPADKQWTKTFDAVTDLIFIQDTDFTITKVNKACVETLKSKPEDIIGKKCYRLFHKLEAPWHNCPFEKTKRDEKTHTEEVDDPNIGIPLLVSTAPIFDDDGKLIGSVHIAKDITHQRHTAKQLQDAYQRLKETQEQLIQSSKMAAMGQLAAGISHELNQPLTGIKGFAQAILMKLNKDNPIRQDLEKIEEQADRMDKIIQNIRLSSRKSEFKVQELDINQSLKDSLMLLSQQLKLHNIRLKESLAKKLPRIKGSPSGFQQVFLNLITNARDAVDSLKSPEGGKIIIKTSLSKDKKNIEVIFQDTGCGIPEKELKDIFNPFFTTKSPNEGIGLGLSIVYRIIESHKGKIEVESKKGQGTSFKITLPVPG